MTKVIVNSAERAKFLNLDRTMEVCDESGRTLGFFSPCENSPASPITEKELDRRRQNLSGRPLAEILKGLPL